MHSYCKPGIGGFIDSRVKARLRGCFMSINAYEKCEKLQNFFKAERSPAISKLSSCNNFQIQFRKTWVHGCKYRCMQKALSNLCFSTVVCSHKHHHFNYIVPGLFYLFLLTDLSGSLVRRKFQKDQLMLWLSKSSNLPDKGKRKVMLSSKNPEY